MVDFEGLIEFFTTPFGKLTLIFIVLGVVIVSAILLIGAILIIIFFKYVVAALIAYIGWRLYSSGAVIIGLLTMLAGATLAFLIMLGVI